MWCFSVYYTSYQHLCSICLSSLCSHEKLTLDTIWLLYNPDLEPNVIDRMRNIINVPFSVFMNIESNEIIHHSQYSWLSVWLMMMWFPTITNMIVSQHSQSQNMVTPAEIIDHLDVLKEKAAKGQDLEITWLAAQLQGCISNQKSHIKHFLF